MKLARLAFPVVFVALTTQADAQAPAPCRPGTVVPCTIAGKPGTRQCLGEGEGFGPCEATPPPPVTGIVFGKYLLITVIYAPPGTTAPQTTTGEQSFSLVSYEKDSTTGTTTTNSSSYKSSYAVSASLGCTDPACGIVGSGSVSLQYTVNNTQQNALNINKKTSSVITNPGPVEDGVDHNLDQIWLFLHPKYDVTINGTDITWTLDPDQSAGLLQYLYAGQLKGLSQISPGLLQDLQAAGITPGDYQCILNADPLAQGLQLQSQQAPAAPPLPFPLPPCSTPASSAPRYVPANQKLPYDPPYAQGDAVPLQTYKIDNSTVSTQTDSTEYDYAESITATGGGFSGQFGPRLPLHTPGH